MNTIPTTARYKCRNWSLNKTTGKTTPFQCGCCTYLQYEVWNVLPFKNVETLYRRFHVQNRYNFSKKKKTPKTRRQKFILQSVSYICLQGSLSSWSPLSVKWSVEPKRFSNAKQTGTTTQKRIWRHWLWELSQKTLQRGPVSQDFTWRSQLEQRLGGDFSLDIFPLPGPGGGGQHPEGVGSHFS